MAVHSFTFPVAFQIGWSFEQLFHETIQHMRLKNEHGMIIDILKRLNKFGSVVFETTADCRRKWFPSSYFITLLSARQNEKHVFSEAWTC